MRAALGSPLVLARLAALCAALAFAGVAHGEAKLRLVATTAELRSLAVAVGGDAIEATHLIPGGQDAESFQPRPQDLVQLRGAKAVLRVGVDYDLWLDRLLAQSGNRDLQRGGAGYIDASVDVALLDVRAGGVGPGDGHAHGRGNPHYWLDPANAEAVTGTILEALMRLDPANAKRYEANRLAFLKRLDARTAEWTQLLAAGRGRPLIAYHDTWPYFARRFRLRFLGIIETRAGVAPSPAHLAKLAADGKRERVSAIVREPHEPARDAEFLASRTGAAVVVLASGVDAVPQARDYLSLIDYNVRALAAAFAKPEPR
ncbi:MAG: metal ABC transporter substrate-binding protein [Betaproteobacteria bacterium]|nr:metal ABC transporter substrate-binding protein [Betaproteobacteria bacterium]